MFKISIYSTHIIPDSKNKPEYCDLTFKTKYYPITLFYPGLYKELTWVCILYILKS